MDGGSVGNKALGGAFTQALLSTLRSTGADKLTYVSLLERMDKIPLSVPIFERPYS